MREIFITGIDTNVGKTVMASVLVEALKADYWKPIQCGDLHMSDTNIVQALTQNSTSTFHPETYRLQAPCSPHQSAMMEKTTLDLKDFILPEHKGQLIIEGAGGVLVPLNDEHTFLDLIQRFKVPAIVVCKNYLGSLNHTMLTIEALKRAGVEILGLIFNGRENEESEKFLLRKTKLRCRGLFREEIELSPAVIKRWAQEWREKWGRDLCQYQ